MSERYEPKGNYFVFRGIRFIHVTEGHAKNWICYQHPEGQWVTLYHIPNTEAKSQLTDLREKVRVAIDYMDHKLGCQYTKMGEYKKICTCGHDALVADLKSQPTSNPIAERALEFLKTNGADLLRAVGWAPSRRFDYHVKLKNDLRTLLSEIEPSKGREEK